MMKETLKVVDKILTQNVCDWLTVKIATYYLDSPGYMVKTGRARWWGHRMLELWYKGEPTPLSLWAPRLLEGLKTKVFGLENVPEGKLIIAINQPNQGILRGNWFKFLLNYSLAEARGKRGNFEAKWVQKADSSNSLIKSIPLLDRQKRRLSYMLAKSCGTILVDATANSVRANLSSVFEMKKHLQNEGTLVVCPEGQASSQLVRGKREAGELLLLLAKKTKAPILPAGAWVESQRYYLRFGSCLNLSECNLQEGQETADLLMVEIAKLLPCEKRGVYRC